MSIQTAPSLGLGIEVCRTCWPPTDAPAGCQDKPGAGWQTGAAGAVVVGPPVADPPDTLEPKDGRPIRWTP
jgi:hypothetical protein